MPFGHANLMRQDRESELKIKKALQINGKLFIGLTTKPPRH